MPDPLLNLFADESNCVYSLGFDAWAERRGFAKDSFGEIAYPAATEVAILDITVPAGETWYIRKLISTTAAGRRARFRVLKTEPGGVEVHVGSIACPADDSVSVPLGSPKLLAGTRLRITILPDALAAAADRVSAALTTLRLPVVE